MDYEYQLVLQISEGCSLTSVDVEYDIAVAIGNSRDDKSLPHFVDGNAMGSGTIEIFLHTKRSADRIRVDQAASGERRSDRLRDGGVSQAFGERFHRDLASRL